MIHSIYTLDDLLIILTDRQKEKLMDMLEDNCLHNYQMSPENIEIQKMVDYIQRTRN